MRPGSPGRWSPRWLPLWILVPAVAGSVMLRLAMEWHWPLPFCLLRHLTGIPCPACGCTRSLAAWSQLDPMAALRFNPLFCLACVGVATWIFLRVVDAVAKTRWSARLEQVPGRVPIPILAGLAVANWLYLCLWLPK